MLAARNAFAAKFFHVDAGEQGWISGRRRDGRDALDVTRVRRAAEADAHAEDGSAIGGLLVARQPDDGHELQRAGGATPAARHDHFSSVV